MESLQGTEDILNSQGISYRLGGSDAESANMAQSIMLGDSAGQIQVLLPADCMLDLGALQRFSGRDLCAVSDEPATLKDLQCLPVIPQLLDRPMIIDRRLLERDRVVVSAGDQQTLIHLERAQFERLVSSSGSSVGSFAVPIAELGITATDASRDDADIGNAVGKFTSRRIEKRLEDTLDFPPLPEIAHRIIQIGADPYASVKDLSRVVEIDPSLSAQVVSWASSPYYSAPGKINSIQDAIVRVLGFDLVMNLALGLALGKTLRLPRDGRYGYRNYWLQSVYCAAMMEGLCKAMPSGKRPPLGYAYLSGLLHNFGFLILAELFKPQLQLVCRYAEANPHVGHSIIERHLLGLSREQMAGWLMKFWHLPDEVCAALRFQTDPAQAGEHETLARVLNLSVRLLATQGVGSAPVQAIPQELYRELGIGHDDAEKVWERISNSTDDLKALARDLAA